LGKETVKTTLKRIELVKVGETVMKEGFSWVVEGVERFNSDRGGVRTILRCRWDGLGRKPTCFQSDMSIASRNGIDIPVVPPNDSDPIETPQLAAPA
jgi:hypothetical protein